MQLLRLRLENFRQHASSEIDFQSGMTAIVGANGTGKSTLLEAVTFALYGEQRDKKETIRFYWTDKKKFSVTLQFAFEGNRFEVERSNTDAHLKAINEGETVWASGLTDVTRACERLLGLTYEQFINSFCAEQKQLAFLQFRTNAAKQEEVARMLGFDRLKAAEEIASQRRRDRALESEILERSLGDELTLKAERASATQRLSEASTGLDQARKAEAELCDKLGPAEEKKFLADDWLRLTSEMAAIGGEAEGLKAAVASTEQVLKEAEAEAAELKLLTPDEQSFRECEALLKTLLMDKDSDQAREKLLAEANSLQSLITEIEAQIAKIQLPDITGLKARVEAAQAVTQTVQQRLKEANQNWQEDKLQTQSCLAGSREGLLQRESALAKAEDMIAKGQCPECGQAIGESYGDILDRLRVECSEAAAKVKRLEKAASDLEGVPKAVEKALNEAEKALEAENVLKQETERADLLNREARTLRAQKDQRSQRLAEINADLAKSPAKFDLQRFQETESRLEALRPKHLRYLEIQSAEARVATRKKAYTDAKAAYDAAKSKYKTLEARRKALPFSGSEHAQEATASYQKLIEQKSSIAAEIKHLTQAVEFAKRDLEKAELRLAELTAKKAELSAVRAKERLYDAAAKEFRSLRLNLNKTIGPELSARASENLSLLTGGRYAELSLDANFNPALLDDGFTKQVISGGEEDVVALALRLALSELIQEMQGRPMSLLILDEVFGSLDADRRQCVLDRLTALKGRFDQILVISHIEDINQVADQCLYLTRDESTKSTKVSDMPPGGFADLI